MPELPSTGLLTLLRRKTLLLSALSLYALSVGAFAQTVPSSLRACTVESDPTRRLACYDRGMARLSASPQRPPSAPSPPELAPGSSPAPAQSTHAPSPPRAAVTATRQKASVPHHKSPWKIFQGGSPSRLTARVVGLERWPDAMVLHLDNGQVWRQVGRASGDLSLETGDSVTIEKHLGSYWLSSRYVSNMQVRQEPR